MLSLIRRLFSRRRGHGATDAGPAATVEVDPTRVRGLALEYAPRADGAPDAGEIVWAWVPFAERDGRGKDRPVLVIARRDAEHVYAVKLTSRSREGDRDFVPVGTGGWDPERRPSWADVDQLYVVHDRAVRREGAALDRAVYGRVAAVLGARYGWRVPR